MTIAFEVAEHIARPTDVVWKWLTDWSSAPEWMKGIDAMEADGPTEAGTLITFHARGKSRETRITHALAGREVTLTSQQGGVSASYHYSCEPDGDGTRVTLSANCEIRGPLRLVGGLLRRLIARSDGGQIQALKRRIESS